MWSELKKLQAGGDAQTFECFMGYNDSKVVRIRFSACPRILPKHANTGVLAEQDSTAKSLGVGVFIDGKQSE